MQRAHDGVLQHEAGSLGAQAFIVGGLEQVGGPAADQGEARRDRAAVQAQPVGPNRHRPLLRPEQGAGEGFRPRAAAQGRAGLALPAAGLEGEEILQRPLQRRPLCRTLDDQRSRLLQPASAAAQVLEAALVRVAGEEGIVIASPVENRALELRDATDLPAGPPHGGEEPGSEAGLDGEQRPAPGTPA